MPILPPRNLPLSPPSGRSPRSLPSTPPSSKARGANTPSRGATPSKESLGTLARQDETTFHRKLRNVLWDHCAACDAWDDLVSINGAKSIAAAARHASSLDEGLKKLTSAHEPMSTIPAPLSLSLSESRAIAMEEIATALHGLQAERSAMNGVLRRLSKPMAKLEALADAAESLLIDTTRSRGEEFVFSKEMWTTWTMEMFGE